MGQAPSDSFHVRVRARVNVRCRLFLVHCVQHEMAETQGAHCVKPQHQILLARPACPPRPPRPTRPSKRPPSLSSPPSLYSPPWKAVAWPRAARAHPMREAFSQWGFLAQPSHNPKKPRVVLLCAHTLTHTQQRQKNEHVSAWVGVRTWRLRRARVSFFRAKPLRNRSLRERFDKDEKGGQPDEGHGSHQSARLLRADRLGKKLHRNRDTYPLAD